MDIEKSLRDYKRKESIVETTLARIKVYEDLLSNPESIDGIFLKTYIEPGMPRANSYKSTSLVEDNIFTKEQQIELIKEWVKEDKSRIYPLQIELEQLKGAMSVLTHKQKYIIKCKYFEGMFWRDIEMNINDEFRKQQYITVSGLRKLNYEAIEKMKKILKPYYNRFKTEMGQK